MAVSDNQLSATEIHQPMTAALYCRVSTGRQEQEATIESQLAEVKARIIADGNVIPEENIFIDDGWSGEILQRPSLDKLRDAVRLNNFQILYVYDRGRLSRIFAHQEYILEELTDKGIKFVSLHDVNADTPETKVLQAMQGVFHEYERIKIAERMRRGKLFKARSGVLINGDALYGYTYVRKIDDKLAHYEINEDEAKVVRMIYKWFGIDRLSVREIIKKLYELGIPPRKRKREFWTKGPITRILKQEAYIRGIIYYNKSEAVVAKNPINNDKYKKIKRSSRRIRPREDWIPYHITPLIDDNGLFEKIQEIIAFNKKYAPKNRKHDYLLAGKVFCECGNRRVGDGYSKGGNHYYRCAERIYRFPLESKCRAHGVNAILLDGLFWRELVKYLNDGRLLKKSAVQWLKLDNEIRDYDKDEESKIEGELNKIHEEEMRYAKAFGVGALDFEQFKGLMKETKRKKALYQAQIEGLNRKIKNENIGENQLDELCEEAKRVIKELDYNNKKELIRDTIDKVTLFDNGRVEVNGHVSLFNLNMAYGSICRDSWVA